MTFTMQMENVDGNKTKTSCTNCSLQMNKHLCAILILITCLHLKADVANQATPTSAISLPDDFKIELIYSVPKAVQGSWVAMCHDDKGRIIVSDQFGGLYHQHRQRRTKTCAI